MQTPNKEIAKSIINDYTFRPSASSEKPNYLLPYPYTLTIAALITLNVIWFILDTPNTQHYLITLLFTTIFGIAQIYGLENLSNVPAWVFPPGSAYFQDKGLNIKHVVLEDILFVPCCASLFFLFMNSITSIPELPLLQSRPFIVSGFLVLIILEAIIYDIGGKGTRKLMVGYTLTPLLVLILGISLGMEKPQINTTHALTTFLFVGAVNCGWELFNSWRKHWVYRTDCELFGEHGWVFNKKLHVGIFIQYFISGYIVMYFCWLFLK